MCSLTLNLKTLSTKFPENTELKIYSISLRIEGNTIGRITPSLLPFKTGKGIRRKEGTGTIDGALFQKRHSMFSMSHLDRMKKVENSVEVTGKQGTQS